MNVGMALRLLAVMVLWASCFPLITIGLHLAPHLAFAAMRAALAGLCLLILGAIFHRPMPKGKRAWSFILLVGIGATTLGFFGMFHAAEFVSPGLATVIANTQPLLTAVLARSFLGERLKALGMAGLAVGLLGIVAIAWPGFVAGGSKVISSALLTSFWLQLGWRQAI
jgi:drug/metabolite transporter (DMT)-like permease